MNESMDRVLAGWLREGPELGPHEGLERTLAATRRMSQLPGWTIPERWIPMQLTMSRTPSSRPLLTVVAVALLTLVLAAAALFVGSRPAPLPAPFGPARNGLIAFDAGQRLFLAEPDFSTIREIPSVAGLAYTPTVSPDGSQIAFLSRPSAGQPKSIWIAPADGSAMPRMVSAEIHPTGQDFVQPVWSPTGARIAFTASDRGVDRIYIADAQGAGVVAPFGRDASRVLLGWSSDGDWLAYTLVQLGADGNATTLAVAHPDGTDERVLSRAGAVDTSFLGAQWSPARDELVYARRVSGGDVIARVGLDGRETVLADAGPATMPTWSPDGSRIAYVDDRSGIVEMAADGTDASLVHDKTTMCGLQYAPDGASLLGSDCTNLVVVPVDDPTGTRVWAMPRPDPTLGETSIGTPSWQRLAP